jgi:hypothetical protein
MNITLSNCSAVTSTVQIFAFVAAPPLHFAERTTSLYIWTLGTPLLTRTTDTNGWQECGIGIDPDSSADF